MFTRFKYLSRRSILEIVTSGVMFDHMGAMLVSLLLTTIPEPYLSLSLLLTTIPGPYLSLSLLLTSHVPGRSSPYLEETCLLEIVTLQAFPVPFEPSLGHVYDVEVPISKKHA